MGWTVCFSHERAAGRCTWRATPDEPPAGFVPRLAPKSEARIWGLRLFESSSSRLAGTLDAYLIATRIVPCRYSGKRQGDVTMPEAGVSNIEVAHHLSEHEEQREYRMPRRSEEHTSEL